MSIIKVNNDDVEKFTIVTTPSRTYFSSSVAGVTGSVSVFPRHTDIEKDMVDPVRVFNESLTGSKANDSNFITTFALLSDTARSARAANQQITGAIESYFKLAEEASVKKTNTLDIVRYTPTTKLTEYTQRKNVVKDILMPYYRSKYNHMDWTYTNYHSLNFFTAVSGSTDLVPSDSVIMYPNRLNPAVSDYGSDVYCSGTYNLDGPFTFDFYINMRYNKDDLDVGEFRAGTIFHLSSSYAVSVITGSAKDINHLPAAFRVQLQLSHSADIVPSKARAGSYPQDLVFLSEDNSLLYNNWHHVVIRWGTDSMNYGTGSFLIDGANKGNFVIPSGTINPRHFSSTLDPSVLFIGNFYEGENVGVDAQSLFFATNPAKRDGVFNMVTDTAERPTSYSFRHPLKAEVHDLAIRRNYVSDYELAYTGSSGFGYDLVRKQELAFYLPPFFVEETPIRRFVGDHGGILQTPFFEADGTTDDPFNVSMAFGVNGHYINLENFMKDFANIDYVDYSFPILYALSGSAIANTTDALEANTFLYSSGLVAKRNLSILPCDDGNFDPNYELLTHERLKNKFIDCSGRFDISNINLDNLLSSASLLAGGLGQYNPDSTTYQDFSKELHGFDEEYPGMPPGSAAANYYTYLNQLISVIPDGDDALFDRGVQRGVPLTIFNRLQDPSSNQVTFFNISDIFYGRRIFPGSFTLKDANISGSFGKVSITLKDDGFGGIYRDDSLTTTAANNYVGNIFYDEGIVVIKNPHLYFFGKNQYEMSFKGVNNVYTSKYEIVAPAGMLNSSSNATYLESPTQIQASSSPTDKDVFVYISGMYFHDENMNVVAKVKLAQPIIKRENDRILFKCTLDG